MNWDHLLFQGDFEQDFQAKGKKKTLSKKSSTPKSSKRKRRALPLVQTEELASSFTSKREKKILDCSQEIKAQVNAPEKNVLNIPYKDIEEETK